MTLFDWIKAKWQVKEKDPPDDTFYLTFMCNDPNHQETIDFEQSRCPIAKKINTKKRSYRARTKQRGIEKRRVFSNSWNKDVAKFAEERIFFDESVRIEKAVIYEDYEEWCEENKVDPVWYNYFFQSLNYLAKDKIIYTSKNSAGNKTYVGISLKSCFMSSS